MDERQTVYILDSYALLAHFQAEPGGAEVRDLLDRAITGQSTSLYLSMINAGEIYYLASRHLGDQTANNMLTDLQQLPITLCQATDKRVISAAKIKAQFPVSYADAFAISLAREYGGIVVTGDPEFKAVESLIDIHWLL